MSSAVKVCLKKSFYTLDSDLGLDETAGEDEYVGIVVCTSETGKFGFPAKSGAYALMFVERHADAVACAADSYGRAYLAGLDCKCAGMGEVGVIAAIGGVSAEIAVGNALRFEIADYNIFEFETGVVAAKADRYISFNYAHKRLILRLIK